MRLSTPKRLYHFGTRTKRKSIIFEWVLFTLPHIIEFVIVVIVGTMV